MSSFPKLENLGTGTLTPEAIMMYEQFGRIGNLTSGEAFLRTSKANETVRVDDAGAFVFIGYAIVGSSDASASWKIKRIKTANVVEIKYAGGTGFYNNIWNNRSSLSYS